MAYRIVQISKPYQFTSRNDVTESCYIVESPQYNTPEEARKEIKSRSDGSVPHAYHAPEEWFIIIQTF